MRRPLIAAMMIAAWFTLPAGSALAQYGGGGGGGRGGPGGGGGADTSADDAAKKKKDDEWNTTQNLALPGKKNAGPCPYVKVLYDAARYVEFKDIAHPSVNGVGYTGEIQGLSSGCSYGLKDPITVKMELLFAFGRGPMATGATKDYQYWVAVTDRNEAVLAKEYFTIHANFPAGADRALVTDHLDGIKIPRADTNVSGSNFEVLVGFDVTPEMADFNRDGKRFHANAGVAPVHTAASPTGTPGTQ
ncbi:MAG TPA: Tat pathway signal sequence domain protein [Caulobacteraceae bacterium]|jgi:hypothetical protein|nr:Tat pathway signal sequence domain protein [Caulobacteraceae bacterium]